jgi:hypothetical protein
VDTECGWLRPTSCFTALLTTVVQWFSICGLPRTEKKIKKKKGS